MVLGHVAQIYEEFIDYMVSKMPPEEILAFKASAVVQNRAEELTARNKADTLTLEERAELEQIIELDLKIAVLKAEAMC